MEFLHEHSMLFDTRNVERLDLRANSVDQVVVLDRRRACLSLDLRVICGDIRPIPASSCAAYSPTNVTVLLAGYNPI